MRARSKALTLVATVVAAFAVLPALGAAADELPPGQYDVVIGDDGTPETYSFTVLEDGTIETDDVDGAEFVFGDDDDDGVYELELIVDGVTYEVAIEVPDSEESEPAAAATADAESYEVSYEIADDDGRGSLVSTVAQCALTGADARAAGLPNHGYFVSAAARGETEFTFEVEGEPYAGDPASFDLSGEDGVTALCDAVASLAEVPVGEETEEPVEEQTEEPVEEGAEEEASHGAIVSTVAQCAPTGRAARDADLPNHGFFVSATARGEQDFTFEDVTYDLSTQGGAEALCAALDLAVGAAETVATDEGDEDGGEGAQESDERRRGPGRSGEAPGRSGDAPGRSGEAPGQMKKNG